MPVVSELEMIQQDTHSTAAAAGGRHDNGRHDDTGRCLLSDAPYHVTITHSHDTCHAITMMKVSLCLSFFKYLPLLRNVCILLSC